MMSCIQRGRRRAVRGREGAWNQNLPSSLNCVLSILFPPHIHFGMESVQPITPCPLHTDLSGTLVTGQVERG